MKLIVGLGNPGQPYEHTRHNIGFQVTDAFIKSSAALPAFAENKKLKCKISKNNDLTVIQPTTFMNNSVSAIQSVIDYYKIDVNNPDHLIIEIHDELDLPFGQLRIQKGAGAAGHKGVKSTMEYLDPQDFWRIRIGINGETKNNIPGDQYVLSEFSSSEKKHLPQIIDQAVSALKTCLNQGPEIAAQKYNNKQII